MTTRERRTLLCGLVAGVGIGLSAHALVGGVSNGDSRAVRSSRPGRTTPAPDARSTDSAVDAHSDKVPELSRAAVVSNTAVVAALLKGSTWTASMFSALSERQRSAVIDEVTSVSWAAIYSNKLRHTT